MRIDEQNMQAASSSAARTLEAQRIHVDSAAPGGGTSAAGDRVDISGLAGRISQALESLADHSASRVHQLQKEFQAGRYQPDAKQLAGALLRA